MYSVKNIVDWSHINFSMQEKVMYDMQSYHSFSEGSTCTRERVAEKIQLLESRLDKLLLKAESNVERLSIAAGMPNMVVQISPDKFRLFFEIARSLSKSAGYAVDLKTYWHSTCSVEDKIMLNKIVENFKNGKGKSSLSIVVKRWIQNDMAIKNNFAGCVLFTSPCKAQPILGEVNVWRFLCRVIAPSLYNEQMHPNDLLDLDTQLNQLASNISDKQMQGFFKSYVTKRKVGNLSIIDLFLFCKVQGVSSGGLEKIPGYTSWLADCSTAFGN